MAADEAGGKLNRDVWIRGALAFMAEGGVNAVKIEPLARRLGVTKGSFYWHFKNRPALLTAILEYWEKQQTNALITIADDADKSPTEKLRTLYDTTAGPSADGAVRNVELTIRGWSRSDAEALMAVRSVDARRSVYVENFFMSLGFLEPEAKARAGLFHGLLFSEALLARDEEPDERAVRVARSLDLLVGVAEDVVDEPTRASGKAGLSLGDADFPSTGRADPPAFR